MASFRTLQLAQKIKILLSTLFFIGTFPLFPGTVGTLAAIPLYLLLSMLAHNLIYIFILLTLITVGIWSSNFAEEYYNYRDPKPVVIDEVAGYLLAMLYIHPSLFNIFLGFIIFRILDIIKPPPARFLEQLKGGVGIISDDLVAGFYTNLLMQISLLILKLI